MEQIQTKTFLEGYAKFNEQYLAFQNDMLKKSAAHVYNEAYKIFFMKSIQNCLEDTALVNETAKDLLCAFANNTINLEMLYSEFMSMEYATVDTYDNILDFLSEVLKTLQSKDAKNKTYVLNDCGKQHRIILKKTSYAANDNLGISMLCVNADGFSEPWDSLTTNFDIKLPKNHAFIRKDKYSEWVIKQNIGTPLGTTIKSGFCQYDLFEFRDDIYSDI